MEIISDLSEEDHALIVLHCTIKNETSPLDLRAYGIVICVKSSGNSSSTLWCM